jgi:SAM-dependent methyltransferase
MNRQMSFYSSIARFYDAENADKTDDIDFYLELSDEYPGAILEIGVGSGRVALPLAERGLVVDGIDNNKPMLERARARIAANPEVYTTLTLQEGDALAAAFPKSGYSMILLSYNMLMHFHQQEKQIALLTRLRDMIADGGILVIDLPNAGEPYAGTDSDAITLERTFIEPESGHMVMQQSVSALDRTTQFMRVLWIYDEITGDGALKRHTAPIVFRYYFPYEVQLLLRLAGFRLDQMLGDMDGSPFEDGCPRMIVLAIPDIELEPEGEDEA